MHTYSGRYTRVDSFRIVALLVLLHIRPTPYGLLPSDSFPLGSIRVVPGYSVHAWTCYALAVPSPVPPAPTPIHKSAARFAPSSRLSVRMNGTFVFVAFFSSCAPHADNTAPGQRLDRRVGQRWLLIFGLCLTSSSACTRTSTMVPLSHDWVSLVFAITIMYR